MEGPRLERTGEALDTEPTGRVFVVRPETELCSHPESHSLMFPGKKFLESLLNTREVSRGEWQTQLNLKQKRPNPKPFHALSQTRSVEPSLVSLHAGTVSAPYQVTPLSLLLPSFSCLPGPDSVLQRMVLLKLAQYSLPY